MATASVYPLRAELLAWLAASDKEDNVRNRHQFLYQHHPNVVSDARNHESTVEMEEMQGAYYGESRYCQEHELADDHDCDDVPGVECAACAAIDAAADECDKCLAIDDARTRSHDAYKAFIETYLGPES